MALRAELKGWTLFWLPNIQVKSTTDSSKKRSPTLSVDAVMQKFAVIFPAV
jgi:hypothetical protein